MSCIIFLMSFAKFVVLIGSTLDRIFIPSYRRTQIAKPVFIFSSPRSGSTFLHRLLENDAQFTYFKLWQLALPSLVVYKFVGWVSVVEKSIGSPIARFFRWVDKTVFGGWDGIHKMGFTMSEEDEPIFSINFSTPGLVVLFPFLKDIPEIYEMDKWSTVARQSWANFIRTCYQKHCYANPGKRLLCKNAVAGGRIGVYEKAFPDMQVIQIRRDPCESAASALSMFSKPWSYFHPECVGRRENMESIMKMLVVNAQGMNEQQERLGQEQLMSIEFDELVNAPEDTVRNIYAHFGLEMNPAFEKILLEKCAKMRDYQSSHSYDLEALGFTETEILQEFALPH